MNIYLMEEEIEENMEVVLEDKENLELGSMIRIEKKRENEEYRFYEVRFEIRERFRKS